MDYTRKKSGLFAPKERLFAPMLSTFGGGSARGFNPGASGDGFGDVVYIARVNSVADESSTFPTSGFMTNTWGYTGGNADGGVINISGSGEYKLYSISIGKSIGSANSATFSMRVYSGTSASSGQLLSSQSLSFTGLTDTSSPYEAQELVFPQEVTLNRGNNYAVAFGMASPGLTNNTGALNGPNDSTRTIYAISSGNGGGTISFSDMTFSDSDPFDATNGTGFSSNNSRSGQLQVFGFRFST